MELNVDVKQIRRDLNRAEWQGDESGQTRSVYVGSWLSLSPSGKIYTPFANSNVAGCKGCNGTGMTRSGPRRLINKYRNRNNRDREIWMKRYGPAFQGRWPDRINRMSDKLNRWMQRLNRPACTQCGGMGSREAFLDEKWREMVTEAFESEDMIYEEDSGDIFAVESRDFPEETEVESPA